MKNQIDLFVDDIEERITAECEKLKKEASPKTAMKKYICMERTGTGCIPSKKNVTVSQS